MRAFTTFQPWASLLILGAKPHEFRRQSFLRYPGHPKVGERVIIHAAARPMVVKEIAHLLNALDDPEAGATGLVRELARPLLNHIWNRPRDQFQSLPLGCALGTAELGEPRRADEIFPMPPSDSDRGLFNWAWPIIDPVPFAHPIPQRGAQGFWRWGGAGYDQTANL